ncbi:MAG: hypothetical protein ACYC0V_20235, partial [Armatimonadota bacterium]
LLSRVSANRSRFGKSFTHPINTFMFHEIKVWRRHPTFRDSGSQFGMTSYTGRGAYIGSQVVCAYVADNAFQPPTSSIQLPDYLFTPLDR